MEFTFCLRMRLFVVLCIIALFDVSSFRLSGLGSRFAGNLLQTVPNSLCGRGHHINCPRSMALARSKPQQSSENIFSKLKSGVFPVAVPAALVNLMGVNPAIAAPLGSGSTRARVIQAMKETSRRNWWDAKIRTNLGPEGEFMLFKFLIIAGTFFICYGLWKWDEHDEKIAFDRFLKEAERDKEYRENMFFEGVKSIERKLANPKLGQKSKEYLTQQMKDLDPKGKIRSFVAGNSSRPAFQDEIQMRLAGKEGELEVYSRFGQSKLAEAPSEEDRHDMDGEGWNEKLERSIYNIEPHNTTSIAEQIRKMLVKLDTFIEKADCMTDKRRVSLITKLGRNFANVYEDEEKRSKAIATVEKNMDNEQYWVRYANKVKA